MIEELNSERKTLLIKRIAEKVVDLKLTPVAIVLLESSKPLSFVASQLLVFFQPIYASIFPARPYEELAMLLEDRANIELLIQEIEKVDEEKKKIKNPTLGNKDSTRK
jgi:hypothetical protein